MVKKNDGRGGHWLTSCFLCCGKRTGRSHQPETEFVDIASVTVQESNSGDMALNQIRENIIKQGIQGKNAPAVDQ